MNNQKNFLKNSIVGILILFVFVFTIFFSGCTESGKEPVSNEIQNTTDISEKIEVKCGGINEACCENNTCSPSDLICIGDKCMNLKINISTDKELYKSKEIANITVTMESSYELNNATLKLYGIHARGKYYLNTANVVNLTSGINVKNIMYNLPSCTGCAGISPGAYAIYAEIMYNSSVISNSTKNIEIRQ